MITLRKALAIFVIVFVVSVGSVREGWGQSQTLTAFFTAPVASMSRPCGLRRRRVSSRSRDLM